MTWAIDGKQKYRFHRPNQDIIFHSSSCFFLSCKAIFIGVYSLFVLLLICCLSSHFGQYVAQIALYWASIDEATRASVTTSAQRLVIGWLLWGDFRYSQTYLKKSSFVVIVFGLILSLSIYSTSVFLVLFS